MLRKIFDKSLILAQNAFIAWFVVSYLEGVWVNWSESTVAPSDWNIWVVAARFMGYIN